MCVCSFSLFLIFCYHFISLHGKKFVNWNVFPNGLKKKKKIINTCTRWHNELNPHTDRLTIFF